VPLQTRIHPRLPVDLSLTLRLLRHGHGDPCVRVDRSGAWWRATRTPEGPATVRVAADGPEIVVSAWGDGAEWAVAAAPELVGSRDSLDGFDPGVGLIRELHRRIRGLRIGRTKAVFEALLPTVTEQKVQGVQARASYRAIVRTWGQPAPGPEPLRLQPAPAVLATVPTYAFHPLGLEARRAGVIRESARRARRLEEALDMEPGQAMRRLQAIPGVGPWTAAEVAAVALGDPDAVSVGDYHLANTVAWALAGEPRADDERMLELLEPFAGHRGRVVRLIEAAGISAPRFGPKLRLQPIAGI
jgi:3-methyladenine DNA glycosylase/8-oxoguanine DNA glycosylase